MSECGQVQLLESQLGRQSVPLRTSPAAAFHQLEFHHAHSMELLALRAQVCGFAAAAHELLTARELTLLTGWMAWVDLWLQLVLYTLCSVFSAFCLLLALILTGWCLDWSRSALLDPLAVSASHFVLTACCTLVLTAFA